MLDSFEFFFATITLSIPFITSLFISLRKVRKVRITSYKFSRKVFKFTSRDVIEIQHLLTVSPKLAQSKEVFEGLPYFDARRDMVTVRTMQSDAASLGLQ